MNALFNFFSITAMLGFAGLSASALGADDPQTAIVTSSVRSATFSTRDLTPGSEVLFSWLLLPPGEHVDVRKSATGNWIHLHLALSGSAILRGPIVPACHLIPASSSQQAAAKDIEIKAGDMIACNYGLAGWLGGISSVENKGAEPFVLTTIDVGGPWAWGMHSTYSEFADRSGGSDDWAKIMSARADKFHDTEQEILKAGGLNIMVEKVTLPQGSRIVVVDRYPTFRMVTDGEMAWGVLAPDANPESAPKNIFKQKKMGQSIWGLMSSNTKYVLSNASGAPVEYLQWSVRPSITEK